jgi:hypothetical protein
MRVAMKEDPINRKILEAVSEKGELAIQDLLKVVPRPKGNHLDFYPLAILLHAGYLQTDTTTERNWGHVRTTEIGKLGFDTKESAQTLFQISLPKGESFVVNKVPRESWCDAEIVIFLTANGAIKLEEIQDNIASKKEKFMDYRVSLLIAVLAALISSTATFYFST